MKFTPILPAVVAGLALAGCAVNPAEINQAPFMSPIGHGLHADARGIPVEQRDRNAPRRHSLFDERKDLYRDPRASRVGDLLTVTISMNDKAILDNKTDRSRDSQTRLGADYLAEFLPWSKSGEFEANVNSKTSTKGTGKIDRAEEVKFSVAAVVVDVLPNGNLLISGSQEVRVNYEMRVVNVGGIVRPLDITRHNTIAYEKVAEARISYGGRGRLMEVQQPAWGQQIYDQVVPF
ncbi:flagellar basal body L-ring protein FlgH [Rhodopseudomonas sp. NSM]|uniref:flagellar basal body L-ring protein FlgH n=1 Tax=Rhodopseudomonas sp. NSM TaxID=3457630 RepID=UPI00403547CF